EMVVLGPIRWLPCRSKSAPPAWNDGPWAWAICGPPTLLCGGRLPPLAEPSDCCRRTWPLALPVTPVGDGVKLLCPLQVVTGPDGGCRGCGGAAAGGVDEEGAGVVTGAGPPAPTETGM